MTSRTPCFFSSSAAKSSRMYTRVARHLDQVGMLRAATQEILERRGGKAARQPAPRPDGESSRTSRCHLNWTLARVARRAGSSHPGGKGSMWQLPRRLTPPGPARHAPHRTARHGTARHGRLSRAQRQLIANALTGATGWPPQFRLPAPGTSHAVLWVQVKVPLKLSNSSTKPSSPPRPLHPCIPIT